MTAPAYLDYFYGDEVKIDSFYRLPRVFLTNEFYSGVPTEAKCLYTLMLDRVTLSMRNGWREQDGRVFIYFTLDDAKRLLHVGKNKAVRMFQQLEKLDLIRRRKQGQGKPARVFVRTFVENAPENADASAPNRAETPTPPTVVPPRATPKREITEAIAEQAFMEAAFREAAPMPEREVAPVPEPITATAPKMIPTPVRDVKRDAPPVAEQAATRTETPEEVRRGVVGLLNDCAVGVRRLGDILAQRLTNGGGIPMNADNAATAAAPDVRKESVGKPIIQSYLRDPIYEGDKWRNVNRIRREIQENVNLSVLGTKDFNDINQLCSYMDIMVDACCGQTPTVRINGSEYSRAMVRERMYELDATHLEYVLECMKTCAPKVRNIRAYILTALFNSYDTMDLYYDAKVAHDMAEDEKRFMEEYGDDFGGD